MAKQQIIIFDSCDGTGKTHMATELSKILGIPYFKNTAEWDHFERDDSYFRNALKYGDPYFISFLKQTNTSVIIDRAYPSEWVYSRVFNRETHVKSLEYSDKHYAEMGAKIIIPYRTSYVNVHDEFQSINEEKLLKIHDEYINFSHWTACDTLRLNVDDENLDREVSEILKFLEK